MPRVERIRRIADLYNPRLRRQCCPGFTYLYLHRAARNLAAAFNAVHERGYVVGDVNESNVLVDDAALATLIDTDSFQVSDGVKTHRCLVGKPEFTPPELQGKSFSEIDRAPEHDRFGLAVLIFQLLMEGTHPFAGSFPEGGDLLTLDRRIAAGLFPYVGRAAAAPPRMAPPWQILAPEVRELMVRCFIDGRENPAARPSAAVWREALARAEMSLTVCAANAGHRYGRHLSACPWCARTRLLAGRDPFPATAAGRRRECSRPATVPPPRFALLSQPSWWETIDWRLGPIWLFGLLAMFFLMSNFGRVQNPTTADMPPAAGSRASLTAPEVPAAHADPQPQNPKRND